MSFSLVFMRAVIIICCPVAKLNWYIILHSSKPQKKPSGRKEYLRTRFVTHQTKPPRSTVAAIQIEIAIFSVEARITCQFTVFAERSREAFCTVAKRNKNKRENTEWTYSTVLNYDIGTHKECTTTDEHIHVHMYLNLCKPHYQSTVLLAFNTDTIIYCSTFIVLKYTCMLFTVL